LPAWPTASAGNNVQFMNIDVNTKALTEKNRERYLFMDKTASR
jgi:para-nitrobenzyl esterase